MAEDDDQIAWDLVNISARELGKNTNAVIRLLDLQTLDFEVVLLGSTFKASDILINPFRRTIHEFAPKAKLVHLAVPTVMDAAILAEETLDLNVSVVRRNLLDPIKGLIT